MLAPPTEQGLPGDMAVGPSELSSGRGGRSTDERRGRRGDIVRSYFSTLTKRNVALFLFLPLFTHVVHDGGLGSLSIEVDHGIDTGRDVPGCRTLSHTVYKEVEAAVFFPNYTYCVASLKDKIKDF